MIRCTLLLIAVSALPLSADPPRQVVDAVPDVYSPVPKDLQRLAGVLSARMRANAEGYLEKVDLNALESAMDSKSRNQRQAETRGALGFLLAAEAESYEYSDDPQIKGMMDRAAKILIRTQEQPGSSKADQVDPYAISGLLAYYRITGDESALAASRRIGDALVQVKQAQTDSTTADDAGELLEPMVDLYRATGDKRYLECSRGVAKLELSHASFPGNDTGQRHSLLFLSGLADLYRITGDNSYLATVIAGWKEIKDNHLAITGAPLPMLGTQPDRPESVTDGCLTAAWIRLSLDLLRIKGDVTYAQELEHALFNQLLAMQDPRTGRLDPCAPVNGTKKPELKLDRCSASVALSIAEIPDTVWGRYENGIAIISYQPGRATIRLRRRATVQIYTEGNYPESGSVVLHVEPSHDIRFPLRLRVPAWATSFAASVGNSHLSGTPGEYLVVDREWRPRDTVRIAIEMGTKLRTDDKHPGEVAVQRGPQLLALTSALNPELKDLQLAGPVPGPLSLKAAEIDPVQTYSLLGEYQAKSQNLILTPFSEATSYRLWLRAPVASRQ